MKTNPDIEKLLTKVAFLEEGFTNPYEFTKLIMGLQLEQPEHKFVVVYKRVLYLQDIYDPTCWKISKVIFCPGIRIKDIVIDRKEFDKALAEKGLSIKKVVQHALQLLQDQQKYSLSLIENHQEETEQEKTPQQVGEANSPEG